MTTDVATDEDGRVLGVVSQGDLLEHEAPHGLLKSGSRQAKRKAGAVLWRCGRPSRAASTTGVSPRSRPARPVC
ncbi:hypothetical protein ACIA5G_30915 [Amycolatopsis sp. NPDC051758]|uniref:hypothetical protein n=1 Tax=Amycolatopsis sp. NPDC051758 TaxID=3363935 RepID=UPI00378C0B38